MSSPNNKTKGRIKRNYKCHTLLYECGKNKFTHLCKLKLGNKKKLNTVCVYVKEEEEKYIHLIFYVINYLIRKICKKFTNTMSSIYISHI